MAVHKCSNKVHLKNCQSSIIRKGEKPYHFVCYTKHNNERGKWSLHLISFLLKIVFRIQSKQVTNCPKISWQNHFHQLVTTTLAHYQKDNRKGSLRFRRNHRALTQTFLWMLAVKYCLIVKHPGLWLLLQ